MEKSRTLTIYRAPLMRLSYFIISIMVLFLFVGGPDYESHRIFKETWDLGHVLLFSLLSFVTLQTTYFKKLSITKSFLYISLLSLCFGLTVEVLQIFIGRDFSYEDIIADFLGTVIGFIVAFNFYKNNIYTKRKSSMYFLIILIFIAFINLLSALIDEVNMRSEFPVLADLSSDSQLSRWDVNKVELSLSRKHSSNKENTLLVSFQPGKYPDVTLQHFMRNWSGYEYIYFRLFNPKLELIEIEIKIYDYLHTKNNYKRSDRFNMVVQLKSGWNEIKIPLTEVKNSPIKRKMDLSKIKSLSLFLNNITRPVKLYLSPIELI